MKLFHPLSSVFRLPSPVSGQGSTVACRSEAVLLEENQLLGELKGKSAAAGSHRITQSGYRPEPEGWPEVEIRSPAALGKQQLATQQCSSGRGGSRRLRPPADLALLGPGQRRSRRV